ncbi:MAG TPA: tyrosine-protein phosphatase [Sedimentisphaerales bacterium]|nr:tyrosine-protein phosphatase [Sedimentisphaerales bacterium]
MAKNEQIKKQRSEKAKSIRGRYTVVLLAGAVLFCAAVYLVKTYGQEMLSLFGSNERDTKAALAAGRKWAQRLEVPGVANLHKISEDLYRGAQPSAEGMQQLKKLGVKTVVNLRSFHTDRDEIGDTGLSYEHIYMKTWHAEDKEVVRFLKIVTDPNHTPVFVHCQRGADRTGTMCAIYRIAVQGWSKDEATEEMTKGGFGFYTGWKNLINYIRELDFEEIKRRAVLEN